MREVQKHGVTLRLRTEVEAIERGPHGLKLKLKGGEAIEADVVLYATGRRANVSHLGLESAGVAINGDGFIVVDGHFQTSVPSVYALGDVIGRKALTPVAIAEAMALVDMLYGGERHPPDYSLVPTAVFTEPNMATVGWTEESARDHFSKVSVFKSDFRSMRHVLSGSSERTFMKIVVDASTDLVLGVHMVGAEAGEIIQGFAVALQGGATKAVFDRTVGIHPSVAEEFVTMRSAVA